ncbi:MAG: ImmA/IrrE family metallo-endopeptidase [Armatimonadetes bacterium]|nr:ImmA/IrrE family metallo-endopeptidase [Armatimonadota bacterium]
MERRIFTAAHELGHLLLHKDAYQLDQAQEVKQEEVEANCFAGYFLMPEEVISKDGATGARFPWAIVGRSGRR